ncbi:MAG: ParB/RepB/Spo0J family partition protein [Bifidobacterium crudilactis]|jgi:ParB family chromosome partitioning protein
MASRSRLGKGLGALFPLIPGDDDEQKSEDVGSDPAPSASSNAWDDSQVSSSQSTTHRRKATTVSRETSTSSESMDTAKPSSRSKNVKANTSKSATTRSKENSDNKKKSEKRKSMPGFDELSHPSDVFFGVSRETPQKKSEDKASKPGDSGTTQESGNSHTGEELQGQLSRNYAQPLQKNESKQNNENKVSLRTVAGGYLAEIAVKDIEANSQQPRSVFDEEELLELSHSIAEVGILQPIVVRKIQSTNKDDSKGAAHVYELIMGERRWRASQLAGLTTIPAIVKTTSDDDMLRDALLENLHRVALNPLEEAAAYQQMIEEFGLTQAELSKSVSKSRPQIANMLRLLQLPGNVQKKVASGVLSAGHARALLGLQTAEEMESVANRIISEGLSVRSTEEIVALKSRATSQKPRTQGPKASPWTGTPVMQNLENHFETKINIKGTQKHGKIEITFSSPEDMARIVNLMLGESGQTGSTNDNWV